MSAGSRGTGGASDGRVKVLLLMTSTAGGAGQHGYILARDMSRELVDLHVAYGPGYPLDEDFAELDLPVRVLSLSREISPITNLRGFVQIYRLLRRERFDVVCTACSIAGFLGRVAALLAGVRTRIHIIHVYASRPYQNSLKRAVYRWIEKGLDPITSSYVAVSQAIKRYGVDTGIMAADKVDVIYNGAQRPEEIGSRDAVRAELGLGPDARVVGTLCRFEPQKGIHHLLRAAARVLEVQPDTEFLLVGDGPLRAELESLARELGIAERVHFAGWRKDVHAMLGAMDLFCLPSLWEPFGIVLAEAALHELPIVASGVDGIPEVVVDGETAHLVPPGDEAGMAERLLALLGDPAAAAAMGRAGRIRTETEFSLGAMVRAFERLFREGRLGTCADVGRSVAPAESS